MKHELFNDNWKFWEDKDAFALIWSVPDNAQTVRLPHDAMIGARAYADSPAGADGAYRDGASYVYYKELYAPERWRDQTLKLYFEGVSRSAMVYVNNQRAALVPYAYTAFYVDLDDYLKYGQVNQIRVCVRTGDMPNSRWYAGGGIYRDVYLLEGGLAHIPPQGLRVTTASLDEDMAVIQVDTQLVNRIHHPVAVEVQTKLYGPDGALAAEETTPLTLMGGSKEPLKQTLAVAGPHPWSDLSPDLYTCRVTLTAVGQELDSAETAFGIRTISVDARRGLRINGRSVKLRGACIHHDGGLLGAATFEEAEFRRMRLLKEAGFNAVRSAHNPMAPVALRACDVLGIYVMDEAFDMWTRSKKDYDYSQVFEKWWRDDLAAMVKKDYNHPSVILYSIGNEIPEIATAHGAALGREMRRVVERLDPTRPSLACINGVFATGDRLDEIIADVLQSSDRPGGGGAGNVNDFMAATSTRADEIANHPLISRNLELAGAGMELMGYNYMTARHEPDGARYPNRVIVGSETYTPEIARNWDIVERCSHVIGDFTWTGWDYLGEAGVGVPAYRPGEGSFGAQYPCQLAYVGDIDITGFRRPASYFREIVFGLRKDPYITVQDPTHYGQQPMQTPWVISDNYASWTHPGFEGRPVVVEVYSPGDEVELLLNGASLGRRAAGKEAGFRALFETVYRPGRLEAIAYEKGRELGRSELTTAQNPLVLRVQPEETDGRELIYVNITLEDGHGVCMNTDTGISALVEGDGGLAGFGSADPKPLTGYTDGVSRMFHGRAPAIVRKTARNGMVALTVGAEGYKPVRMEIRF